MIKLKAFTGGKLESETSTVTPAVGVILHARHALSIRWMIHI